MKARLDIANRTLVAALGGYGLANAAAALGALALPLDRHEAVTWTTMAAFVIHLLAILWAFAAGSAWQAWRGVLVPIILCAGAAAAIRSA